MFLNKHNAVITYGEMEIYLHVFITLALDDKEVRLTPMSFTQAEEFSMPTGEETRWTRRCKEQQHTPLLLIKRHNKTLS
jgi:hypothetical protein